jgi:hypothetical protein
MSGPTRQRRATVASWWSGWSAPCATAIMVRFQCCNPIRMSLMKELSTQENPTNLTTPSSLYNPWRVWVRRRVIPCPFAALRV